MIQLLQRFRLQPEMNPGMSGLEMLNASIPKISRRPIPVGSFLTLDTQVKAATQLCA
jgi:hypothetical protein